MRKLERTLNVIQRIEMRRRFLRWAKGTKRIVDVDDATFMLSKRLYRRRLKNAFNKYKKQIKDHKRMEYISKRV
jgi:hypothetical protein